MSFIIEYSSGLSFSFTSFALYIARTSLCEKKYENTLMRRANANPTTSPTVPKRDPIPSNRPVSKPKNKTVFIVFSICLEGNRQLKYFMPLYGAKLWKKPEETLKKKSRI